MKFLTTKEISEMLSLSKGTIYRMVRDKKIPHYKINNELRFKLDEITKWIKAQRAA